MSRPAKSLLYVRMGKETRLPMDQDRSDGRKTWEAETSVYESLEKA